MFDWATMWLTWWRPLAFRAPRGLVVPGGHHCARRPPSTNVSATGKLAYGRS